MEQIDNLQVEVPNYAFMIFDVSDIIYVLIAPIEKEKRVQNCATDEPR